MSIFVSTENNTEAFKLHLPKIRKHVCLFIHVCSFCNDSYLKELTKDEYEYWKNHVADFIYQEVLYSSKFKC